MGTDAFDPRTVRRAVVRGALALLVALVPTLLAGRPVATPLFLALVLIPFTLAEEQRDPPSTSVLFVLGSALAGLALVNGVYVEGVLDGRSLAGGLGALARVAGADPAHLGGVAGIAIAAQMIGLGLTFAVEMVPVDRERPVLDPIIFGPPLVGLEVGALTLAGRPGVAVVAGVVFTLLAVFGACLVGALVRALFEAADRIEERFWPGVAM